jgi:hypothetical protein
MRALALIAVLLVAGCSKVGGGGGPASERAESGPAAVAVMAAPAPGASDVAVPQIAYRYARRYRTPVDGIAALQARHMALCEQAGRGVCHVLLQRVSEAEAGQDSELILSVTASRARAVLNALDKAVAGTGGDVVASTTEAEDLGTRIVDTEARLRAKQALADRLLAIIKTRGGGIKDLVAAEQAYAEAQGDLDASRAQLALLRRQVARSVVTLRYAAPAGVEGSFNDTLRPAFDEAGTLLGQSLAALVRFLIITGPWALLIGLPLGWWWRRRRARKAAGDKPPQAGNPA